MVGTCSWPRALSRPRENIFMCIYACASGTTVAIHEYDNNNWIPWYGLALTAVVAVRDLNETWSQTSPSAARENGPRYHNTARQQYMIIIDRRFHNKSYLRIWTMADGLFSSVIRMLYIIYLHVYRVNYQAWSPLLYSPLKQYSY